MCIIMWYGDYLQTSCATTWIFLYDDVFYRNVCVTYEEGWQEWAIMHKVYKVLPCSVKDSIKIVLNIMKKFVQI